MIFTKDGLGVDIYLASKGANCMKDFVADSVKVKTFNAKINLANFKSLFVGVGRESESVFTLMIFMQTVPMLSKLAPS